MRNHHRNNKKYVSNKLWIRNISKNVTMKDLRSLFETKGKVSRVYINSQQPFGFIEFKEIECAKVAKDSLHGEILGGNRLHVEFAYPDRKDTSTDGQHNHPRENVFPSYPGSGQQWPPTDVAATSTFHHSQGVSLPNTRQTVVVSNRQHSGFNPSSYVATSSNYNIEPQPKAAQLIEQPAPQNWPWSHRPETDYIWRGIIAKGGVPICHARCVPIGEWMNSADIPQRVNCSQRTTVHSLSRYYSNAIGFNIAVFLPDTTENFAPYTELLAYFTLKERAGVAKLSDGTSLFLVPPSEFLKDTLKFVGMEQRLYGVVIKFPRLETRSNVSARPTPSVSQCRYPRPKPENVLSQHSNRPLITSSTGVSGASRASIGNSGPNMGEYQDDFALQMANTINPENYVQEQNPQDEMAMMNTINIQNRIREQNHQDDFSLQMANTIDSENHVREQNPQDEMAMMNTINIQNRERDDSALQLANTIDPENHVREQNPQVEMAMNAINQENRVREQNYRDEDFNSFFANTISSDEDNKIPSINNGMNVSWKTLTPMMQFKRHIREQMLKETPESERADHGAEKIKK